MNALSVHSCPSRFALPGSGGPCGRGLASPSSSASVEGDGFRRADALADPSARMRRAALICHSTARAATVEAAPALGESIHRADYRVEPGAILDLSRINPDRTPGVPDDPGRMKAEMKEMVAEISALQEKLYAEHKHKVLFVFQGMDTSGKDSTIQAVFSGSNPQGVKVASFKAPTAKELDHDYLWRVHQEVPGKGEIGIFNRSHYEDVLITRVHGMIDSAEAEHRFKQIGNFEQMLAEEGTTVVKVFLHIDKDEQKRRLQERLDNPEKTWKFDPSDLAERKYWDDYQKAYSDAITRTSTKDAPWYIVPANSKKPRNYVVASIVLQTLRDLDMQWPKAKVDPSTIRIDA